MLQNLLPTLGLYDLLAVLTLPFAYLTNELSTLANDFPKLFIQLVNLCAK
jgi:hypothetical protein